MNNAKALRFAVIGSSIGNGHPYSWSAILNGYDSQILRKECPFPGIPSYLDDQPEESFPMGGAKVTHISCKGDGGFTAESVARSTFIPNVASRPEDVIGDVDAVVIATDNGAEHLERSRPFVEAGLPIFIDKPLTISASDLQQFREWVQNGAMILSSSSMRYAKEFLPFHGGLATLGEVRYINATAPKNWETYGIHALEAIYPMLGPGFETIRNIGTSEQNIVHIKHKCGADVVLGVSADMLGGLGDVLICGTEDSAYAKFRDSFSSFQTQLSEFVTYVRTGNRPYPFEETIELTQMVIAGLESRKRNGAEIVLPPI